MKDPYLLIKTVTTVNTVSLPNDPLLFVANASDLNYPPGFFPYVLKTEIGNGRPFEFVRKQIVTTPAFDHEAWTVPASPATSPA